MRLPVVTLMALALAAPAAAQMAYRHVFPDGRVVYSDQSVMPGAEAQSTLAPPPPSLFAAPGPAADPGPTPATASAAPEAVPGARWPPPPDTAQPAPVAAPAPIAAPAPVAAPAPDPAPERVIPVATMVPSQQPERAATSAAAFEDIRAAERNLAAAQATLEAGREPQAGERTGLAGGGSRLNAQYWDRQRQLESGVADAQARLDRALAARTASR